RRHRHVEHGDHHRGRLVRRIYFLTVQEEVIRPTLFVILTTNMIPPAVILLPLFLFARSFGLYDTRVMMIIVYTAYNLAFVIWMLRSFFLDIPAEIEES